MKRDDLLAWETNAEYWDTYMGQESNFFHRDLVRPKTDELLGLTAEDRVLDIACGNGNYSEWMATKGVEVVAFDFSPKMIDLARKRRVEYEDRIQFHVCDATDYDALLKLHNCERPFTKAVANMAIMDIVNIEPLFGAVYDMLVTKGSFVFAFHHPCFTFPNDDYLTKNTYKGVAIDGQPELQCYYHRSLQDILALSFRIGFVLDGLYEIPFDGENVPIISIIRLKKLDL